ncbi:ESF1 homolog [Drosophila kikkawai]|uniref:ESF1 homolog n=1 Tax=Drosophila kikkawai TaxID=30033 RepID=A0A6P4J7I9_DROKI|nr:pre-rRNA-processing protein esf1 [Drosophila kikkawai]
MAKTKGKKSEKSGKKANKEKVKPTTSSQADKASKVVTAGNNTPEENGIWRDARFQHLLADPRFRGVPKVQRKVKIDKRFQGMFTDDKFKVKYTVDKYGRPVNKSNAEDLRKFYELDENDSDSDEEELKEKEKAEASDEEQQERRAEELAIANLQGNDALEDSDDDSDLPQNLRERLTNPDVDYARGEGRLMTDSSSDEDSAAEEEDEGPELQIDHVWGELDNDAESTEESTRRLAVCNMDWDRIRAEDLMVMLSSFLPPGGSILSVKIYPSEFGKARMAEEEVHGPKELVERREEPSDDSDEEELVREQDSDAEEGDDYHMEKLRQYQLNRLRYYYAVVECDTVATADKVYQECDGIEYESSATRVDLRFIPDDTSFEEDTPTDECHELPDASSYKPRQFTTTALQQAKVDLTWDEMALDRRELGDKLSSGQVDKLTDKELRQIVAYSSEEESEEEEQEEEEDKEQEGQEQKPAKPKKPSKQERIANYKNLLAEILQKEKQEKEQKYEMEMSWNVTDDTPGQEQEKEQQQPPAELTPIEKVLQKRSEKNKLRKEQRRQKQLEAKGGDPDDNDSDASLVPDGIDLNDAYFAEEFANGDYAPPKTKQQKKKAKSKGKGKVNGEEDEEQRQQERELELLLDDGDGRDEKQHFSLSKILKQEELEQSASGSKRKRRQQLKKSKSKQLEATEKLDDDFQVNVEDARFKAVYKSHEFNIDPTHSHYKATKGMQRIIGEKLKRRQEQVEDGGDEEPASAAAPKRSKQQLEQNALVKSLKRKIQQQEQRGQKL